jgi:hypothetical protein
MADDGSDKRQRRTPQNALHNPLRRRIMRRLNRAGVARGAQEAAGELGLELTLAAYHFKVLELWGAAHEAPAQADGVARYLSAAAGNDDVKALLKSTEAQDEARGTA